MQSWIALDVETTGLSPTRHQIRELAAIPFGIAEQRESVLRFTASDFQPSARLQLRERLGEIIELVAGDVVLVAHHAAFDVAFLAETLRQLAIGPFLLRAYCTLRLARILLPEAGAYDLVALRKAFHIETGLAHAARADAQAVAILFPMLVQRAGLADENALRALHGPPVQVRCQSAAKGS